MVRNMMAYSMIYLGNMQKCMKRWTSFFIGITPAGFGSANNLYLTYKREFGIAPSERLQQLRQERDGKI